MSGAASHNFKMTKRNITLYCYLFILLFFGVACALVISEIVLRLYGFSYCFSIDKVQFGSSPLSDQTKELQTIPQGRQEKKRIPRLDAIEAKSINYELDNDLFWVQAGYHKKLEILSQQNPVLIFCGDSCTDIGNYDIVFIDLLKRELPDQTRISHANLSVVGWTSFQGKEQMMRDIVKLKPRVVTIFFGWNDHWMGFGIEDKNISRINNLVNVRLQKFRVVQLMIKTSMVFLRSGAYSVRVSSVDFKRNLQEMIVYARRNNIVPILLTAPTSHQKGKEPVHLKERYIKNLDLLIPIHQEYVSIVRDVAASENVILCDLAKRFDKFSPDELTDKYFFFDGIHLTQAGNEKIAEFLFDTFKEHDLMNLIPIH